MFKKFLTNGSEIIWLEYNEINKTFYRIVCLAFAKSTETNLFITGLFEKRDEIRKEKKVLKVIGKRGLSYRGLENAAYKLENKTLDHSLVILTLVSKYDVIL